VSSRQSLIVEMLSKDAPKNRSALHGVQKCSAHGHALPGWANRSVRNVNARKSSSTMGCGVVHPFGAVIAALSVLYRATMARTSRPNASKNSSFSMSLRCHSALSYSAAIVSSGSLILAAARSSAIQSPGTRAVHAMRGGGAAAPLDRTGWHTSPNTRRSTAKEWGQWHTKWVSESALPHIGHRPSPCLNTFIRTSFVTKALVMATT